MKKQDKANRIAEILDDLYPTPPIPLEQKIPSHCWLQSCSPRRRRTCR